MYKINQIVPISDMKVKQPEVLSLLNNGPVVLAQRSRPAAVLVSISQWDKQAEELARLQRIVKGDQALANVRAGNYADHDEVLAALREAA
jgi:prevent-host-death family protein